MSPQPPILHLCRVACPCRAWRSNASPTPVSMFRNNIHRVDTAGRLAPAQYVMCEVDDIEMPTPGRRLRTGLGSVRNTSQSKDLPVRADSRRLPMHPATLGSHPAKTPVHRTSSTYIPGPAEPVLTCQKEHARHSGSKSPIPHHPPERRRNPCVLFPYTPTYLRILASAQMGSNLPIRTSMCPPPLPRILGFSHSTSLDWPAYEHRPTYRPLYIDITTAKAARNPLLSPRPRGRGWRLKAGTCLHSSKVAREGLHDSASELRYELTSTARIHTHARARAHVLFPVPG